MITKFLSSLNLITIILCIIILIYCFSSLKNLMKRGKTGKYPRPLLNLYEITNNVPLLGHLVDIVYRGSNLQYSSRDYSKCRASILLILCPILSVLFTLITSIMISKWYLLLALALFYLALPYMVVSNKDKMVNINIKIEMLLALNQFTTIVTTSDFDSALEATIKNAQPNARRILREFETDRQINIPRAYNNLKFTCGDYNINSVCNLLKKYEDYGTDNIEKILKNIQRGLQMYTRNRLHYAGYKDMSLVALICIGFGVFMYLLFSMMLTPGNPLIFSVGMAMGLKLLLECHFYRSSL